MAVLFQWLSHKKGAYQGVGEILEISESTAHRIGVRRKQSPNSMREPVARNLLKHLDISRRHLEDWLAVDRSEIRLNYEGKADLDSPAVETAIAELLKGKSTAATAASKEFARVAGGDEHMLAMLEKTDLSVLLAHIARRSLNQTERERLASLIVAAD